MWFLGQAPPGSDSPILEYGGWASLAVVVLGWLAREFLPYLKDRRKADMEEKHAEEERLIQPYKDQIIALRSDLSRLDGLLTTTSDRHEKEVGALRTEHLECVKNHAALEATVKHLESEVAGLRQWRHEQAGQAQAAIANAEADRLEKLKAEGK